MDSKIAVDQLFTLADNSYNGQSAECKDTTSQTPAKRKKRSQPSLKDGATKRKPKASSSIKLIQANRHTHLNSCDVNVISDQQKRPLEASENKKVTKIKILCHKDLRTAHLENNVGMQHGSKTESMFENAPTTDMMLDMMPRNPHNYPFKCTECSMNLKCVRDIEKHYNRDHPRQDVRMIERKSGFVYSNSGKCLRWKYNFKASTDSYLCSYCAFRSMTRFRVEHHIRRVHPKREVRVFSLCMPNTGRHRIRSESTSKVTALPHEASSSNSPTPSSYFCNVCSDVKNSEFLFRFHLASHPCYKYNTQHVSERRFKCFMCEHDSQRRINIRVHIKRVHNKTVDDDVGIIANGKRRNVDSRHALVNIKPRLVLINLFKQQPNYLQRLVLAHGIKSFDFIVCGCPDILKSKQYGRYFAIE